MSEATNSQDRQPIPEFKQVMGHPSPLWMLFMSEFWERFAFYGIRWALVLYIVAQFYSGDQSGQADANLTYGSYLALVYAGAIFGGYVADKIIGYQRSILIGAVFMAAGLFMIMMPDPMLFKFGLATVIVGNGLFKPNISTMVGKLYSINDERRDSGFTIFYMGINMGAFIAPIITGWLATSLFGTDAAPAYQYVFGAAGVGMLISMVWFYFGRRQLQNIGRPPAEAQGRERVAYVSIGALCVIPLVYALLMLGAEALQYVLTALFVGLAAMLMIEGIRGGAVARDKTIAMLKLVHVPRRPDCQPGPRWLRLPNRLVSVSTSACSHHARARRRLALGVAGEAKSKPLDSAQVRPRLAVQWSGFPVVDVRADEPGERRGQDSVLDHVHGVHHSSGRRALFVADRPVDGNQAGPGAPGRPWHGRLVPFHRHRQQSLWHLRRRGQRRDRHDHDFGAFGLHLRLLGPGRLWRRAVPDRAVDPALDARREVTMPATGRLLQDLHGHPGE